MFNYRKLRKDFGLLQKPIAELMSLSQPGFSKYENENIEPTLQQYSILCEHFGKEAIDSYYFEENSDEKRDKQYPMDSELVQLIVKQNETISKQIEMFYSFSRLLNEINAKLDNLLSKSDS